MYPSSIDPAFSELEVRIGNGVVIGLWITTYSLLATVILWSTATPGFA